LILPNPYFPVPIAAGLAGRLHAHSCAAAAQLSTSCFHEIRLEICKTGFVRARGLLMRANGATTQWLSLCETAG
jgi:hypothetical protein